MDAYGRLPSQSFELLNEGVSVIKISVIKK